MPQQRHDWIWVGAPIGLAILAYLPSLSGDFVYDDISITVLADPYVQGRISWLENLGRDRPLRAFTYAMDRVLWSMGNEGPGAPWGYHLQNLFWHVLNVYLLVKIGTMLGVGRIPGTIAASVLAVHPMGSEAVAWISGRKDLLCLSFQLLSFYCLLKMIVEKQSGRKSIIWGSGAVLSLILALLSKQVAVMMPGLAVVWLWLGSRNGLTASVRRMGWMIGALSLTVLVMAILQLRVSDAIEMADAPGFRDPGAVGVQRTWFNAVLTGSWVWGEVHRLLLLPWDPTLERRVIPVESLHDLRWLGGLLWTAAASGLCYTVRKQTGLVLAGYATIIIAWIPTSGVLPIAYLLADRYLYVPLVGYGLLAAGFWEAGVLRWPSSISRKRITAFMLLVIALMLMRTYVRCYDWRDDRTLLLRTIEQTGPTPRLIFGLGHAYQRQGEWDNAIEYFQQTLSMDPTYQEARLNLGFCYKKQGHIDRAEEMYRACLAYDPHYGTAHYNLALILEERGNIPEALDHYRRAAETLVSKAETELRQSKAWVQVARIQLNNTQHNPAALGEASRALHAALELDPASAEAWDYEGRRRILAQDIDGAVEAWERSLELDAARADVWYNLGLAQLQRGNRQAAEACLKRAQELNPRFKHAVQDRLGN